MLSVRTLSDDALTFGFAHFGAVGSTLSFGGDYANMEITPRARAALNELLDAGFVVANEPQDQWPNREDYIAVKSVAPELCGRDDLCPFDKSNENKFSWSTFIKKAAQATCTQI